jgi:CRISPR/Cas system-associated exonuclease Cas4 (RecB family)
MRATIEKFDWLTAMQCPVKAWHAMRAPPPTPTEAEQFRMQQGQEVGALARKLYPSGVFVFERNGKSAVEVTQDLIADPKNLTLFEPTFLAPPFVAKADILVRENGAWHVQEVKSSFADTSNLADLADDLAYTVMVCRRAGLAVAKASLFLLSRDYRFGDGPERLFKTVDVRNEVNLRVAQFEAIANATAKIILSDNPPTPVLVPACRGCPYFTDKCLGAGLRFTVLELPRLSNKKLQSLSVKGIIDLTKLPKGLELNARQARVLRGVGTGKTIVEPGLTAALQAVQWPCHYLDFETVMTFRPLYPEHGCHRQVLTQFSIHHRESLDSEVSHSEYLADPMHDGERVLAESLIAALGQHGSIIVYSHFEHTRIKVLRDSFDDLSEQLQSILDRLVDLLPIVADHVYHPEFRGSFSLKRVLPALVPELSYEGLGVKDGDMATTRFAKMARGEISGPEIETTRRQLLEYCKLDTLAMVRLHEVLHAR